MNIQERFDKFRGENAGKYSPECFERVGKLVRYQIENSNSRKFYLIFLKEIDDFDVYYRLHPEWHGKPRDDKESGFYNFYQAFTTCIKKQSRDKKERSRLRGRVLEVRTCNYWSHLKTLDNWKSTYEANPQWHGKSTHDKDSGFYFFYNSFVNWVYKKTKNEEERKKLRRSIIEGKTNEWSHLKTLDDWKKVYESHPEWHGKSTKDKDCGLSKFYCALNRWICKQTVVKKERRKLTESVISKDSLRTDSIKSSDTEKHRKNYISYDIPQQFRRSRRMKKRENTIKKIKGRLDEKTKENFDKGVLFEQYVGMLLKYASPQEIVIGQYCLNVDEEKGRFSIRADFKVGNDVFEVKLGSPNSSENIRRTIKKQIKYCEGEFIHNLVTLYDYELEEDLQGLTNHFRLFDLAQGDEDFLELAQKIHDNHLAQEEYESMIDFAYDAMIRANEETAEGRQSEDIILDAVKKLNDGRYKDEKPLHKWDPLEAFYEVDGKIHPGHINISDVFSENDIKRHNQKIRRHNFKELSKIMDGIPEGSAMWDRPSAVLYQHNGTSVLVVKDGETEIKYEIRGSSHKRQLNKWIGEGRVWTEKEKFIKTDDTIVA